jgi:putative membrane protein
MSNLAPDPPPEDPRVRFAAERTPLAWVRTGIALMGFGFVVARFGLFLRGLEWQGRPEPISPRTLRLSPWIGTALILLGVGVTLFASLQHARERRRLARGEPYRPSRWSLGIVTAVAPSALGVLLAGYLLVTS